MTAELTPFSEDRREGEKYFLGDYSDMMEIGDAGWQGDELIVETSNAAVRVQYDDEVLQREPTMLTSFFGKFLGL